VILVLALALLASPPAAAPLPIRVEALVRETPEGPVRSWIAWIDLANPRVSFVVTGPLERREGDPERAEARLVPTDVWAERAGVDLAVNAGFFAQLEGSGAPLFGWTDALPVDLLGLSRSEGRTVSPPRDGGGERASPDPALLIHETKDGHCPCTLRATYAAESDLAGVEDAVAGMGRRGSRPGTLLVEKRAGPRGDRPGGAHGTSPAHRGRRQPRRADGAAARRGRPPTRLEHRRHPAGARADDARRRRLERRQPRRRRLDRDVAPGAGSDGRPRPQPPERRPRPAGRQPPGRSTLDQAAPITAAERPGLERAPPCGLKELPGE